MATATYFKNTPNSSTAASFTWSVACAVGSTIFIAAQHQNGGAVTFTDTNGNTWTKVLSTLDYTTPATTQRIMDVYTCTPTVAVTSVTVSGTATYWILQAMVVNAAVTVRSSTNYFGGYPSAGSLTVVTGDLCLAFVGYAAATGGTAMDTMASPWTSVGLNNFSTTQSTAWKIASVASSGSQTVAVSGVTVGVIGLALTSAGNTAPVVAAGGTQTVASGTSVSLAFSATDNVSVTSLTGAVTGPATPTLTGTASGTGTASATYAPTVTFTTPGQYTVTATASDGTLTGTASTTVYVYAASGTSVDPVGVGTTTWTTTGAGSALAAITGTAAPSTKYIETPTGPTGQTVPITLAPQGPGAITIYVEGYYNAGALTRTLTLYKADGTTQVDAISYALPSADTEYPWAVSTSQLTSLVPAITDRQALILTIADA